MTLLIDSGYKTTFADADVQAYLTKVEEADGQALEYSVAYAINSFVLGCKSDSIWSAIKASCILAGARTLNGALVPLVGTAPTNNNFVAGDYNRKTGLVGNGSNKYLNSNRAGNADPQDSSHLSVQIASLHNPQAATPTDAFGGYLGNGGTSTGATHIGALGGLNGGGANFARSRNSTLITGIGSFPPATGFYGISRNNSTGFTARTGGVNSTLTLNSQAAASENYFVFARNNGSNNPEGYLTGRLSFYSIGESLDLALLDTRVSALMTALGTAIP